MDAVHLYRRPWLFYSLSTVIPWAFWLTCAWISHLDDPPLRMKQLGALLALLGILAPTVVAACLILGERELRRDCGRRLVNLRGGWPREWLMAATIMPASILLAISISVLLGSSATQFHVNAQPSFTAGALSPWAILITFPILEEFAWHTYGTDALRRSFTLFSTSMMFSVFWAVWHAPLGLIKGYYHSNLVDTGMWAAINFPLSIFPVVFLMNWLYYRAGRSIWIAVLFHVTSGLFNELFSPDPMTKVVQTGLLYVLAAIVVMREKELFLTRQ